MVYNQTPHIGGKLIDRANSAHYESETTIIRDTMHTKYDYSVLLNNYNVQSSEDFITEKIFATMRNSPMWNAQLDKILCNVEHVVYLSYCMMKAESNAERLRMVGAFLLFRSNTSVAMKAKKFLMEDCPELFSETFRVQSEELRSLLDSWDRANESTLAIKLRAVASYCMAFSILEHCGFTPHFAEIIYAEFRVQKETKKVTSFVYSILDVVEFVLSRARICWDNGSLQPLFHSSSTYLDWYAKVDEVRLMSRMRGSPDDIEGLRDQDYYLLLEDCITKGENMISFTKTAAERKTMGMIIAELKILRHNSAIEQSVSKPREEPLGVLIPGDPGIGKSTVTQILGKHYATVRGINFTPECRFDRNPFDDFMSGFKSSMWFIVMDDVACLEPNKCPSGDKSLADVIQLINMAPYTSNQAELEKKGKVPVLAKLVVANTNVLDMNVFYYFSHPSAVQRRFKFVLTPYVKDEFCKTDGQGNKINMLDGEKANIWFEAMRKKLGPDADPIADYWDFEVLEWLPVPIGGRKKLATNHYPFGYQENGKPKRIGMKMFLNYYTVKIEQHIKNQTRMLANMAAMRSIKCCGVCGRSLQFCIDREAHRVFDQIACSDCGKTECLHKHQCRRCDCMGITARCEIHNECCEHRIHRSFCPTCRVQVQSEPLYECTCGKDDCLWKLYPEAIACVCTDCGYCMSEEDVMEGSCTVCLVKAQWEAQYHVQSGDFGLMGWFALYLCAFLIQLRKLQLHPSAITDRYHQLETLANRGHSAVSAIQVANNYVENAYDQATRIRQSLVIAGARAGQQLASRPVMMLLGVVISLVAIGKSCISMHSKFSEQSSDSTPVAKDEKKDPWKVDNYVLTPLDVGRKTSNFQTWNRDDMQKHIQNNMFIMDVKTKSPKRTRALAICDRYYIINTHALQGYDECEIDFYRKVGNSVGDNVFNIRIEKHQIFHISEEITIMFIPQLPNRKDIRELFARRTYNGTSHGYYLYRSNEGEIKQFGVRKIKGYNFRHPGLCNNKMYRAYEGTCDIETMEGFCGSPLIAETALGPAILGIHSAGNSKRSVIASPVYLEDINDYFKGKMIIDTNDVILDAEGINYSIQDLHPKSCFRYLDQGSVTIYGSLNAPRSTMKSMVKKTIIADYLINEEGYKMTHGAPVLKGYVPIHKSVVPMIDPAFKIPHSLVQEAVNDYFNTVESNLNADEYCILQKLDMDTIINGADGIRGIDKINMNTSAGFPWKRCKKNLFNFDGEKWSMNDELTRVVKRATIVYKLGRRNNFVFTGSLKDEPKKFEKIEAGETRVFTGQNVAHLLIGRQYYLSFIRLMQRNNLTFENAVGCNAHSDDWDKIAHYLIDFSNNLFDGDYKNYDKSMMGMTIMVIFDGIIDFHKRHSKMDQEDFIVMRGIAYDIAYSYVDYFGDLVSFLRNNPSGHLLTVIVNSICGSSYLRIGYHLATGKPISNYRYDVRAVTYGDDVIVSVKDEVADEFNFQTYQAALSRIGLIFTPASKDGAIYNFKPLDEIDFLKRSFVFNDELDRYSSPLSKTSLQKSLLVNLRSKSITAEEQIVATLASAHREAWQHGKEYFNEFTNLIHRVLDHHKDLNMYVVGTTFLSYDKLREYYRGDINLPNYVLKEINGEMYEIQSGRTSTYKQSNCSAISSYCNNPYSIKDIENGLLVYTYQGVPRNSYLGKIWLVVNYATSCYELIVLISGHSSIAKTYTTIEKLDDKIQERVDSTLIKESLLTGVTGVDGSKAKDERDYNNTGTRNPVDVDLANFLARPIVALVGNWSNTTGVFEDIDAFKYWASDPAISRKLSNYAYIRGKLCARVIVDSNPFNYGMLHASFLAGARSISLTASNSIKYSTYLGQRPGGYINISFEKSLDMSATLLHRGEWYSLEGVGVHSYPEYGVNLTLNTIFALGSVFNVSQNLTYRVYLWMEDVELAGATYMIQSQDVVPNATKTSTSSVDAQTIMLKEMKLDPSVGLPVADLNMKAYLDVNPYIDTFIWHDSLASGSKIAFFDPCPALTHVGADYASSTPLSFMDRYFTYWRGSLIFTFKIICAKAHSGTLRITWDPLSTQGGDANVQLTKIVNIQEEQEFEFIVPFNQNRYGIPTDFGLPFPTNHIYDGLNPPLHITKNGIVTIKAMNVLNGPTTNFSVGIAMFMRPGPDFEFLRLSDGTTNISSTYKIQSQDIKYVEHNEKQYMGESFDSVRDMIERPQFYQTLNTWSHSVMDDRMFASELRFPITPGPSTSGSWITANTNTVPVNSPPDSVNRFHNCKNTFLGQLITQYVGVAGSVKHSVVTDVVSTVYVSLDGENTPLTPFIVPYGTYTQYSAGTPVVHANFIKRTINESNRLTSKTFNNWRGAGWINKYVNPIGHFCLPHLSNYKYHRVNDHSDWDTVTYYFDGVQGAATADIFVSAGKDFQLIQFSGVLPMGSTPHTGPNDHLYPYYNGISRAVV